jgi:hypothetical protein
MKIDLLYIDDCPSWQGGLENLKAALEAEGVDVVIRLVKVSDDAEATRLKFLGSPAFCVNGADFWLEQRERYHLNCRIYATPQGLKGAPTVEMLREKVRTLILKNV